MNRTTESAESHFSDLARAVRGLSQSQFEQITFGLSPQEGRLFRYLRDEGIANTPAIRMACSIGNVSQAATFLSRKLEPFGLRVHCDERSHRNRFGNPGVIGWWSIVELDNGTAGVQMAKVKAEMIEHIEDDGPDEELILYGKVL